MRRSTCTPTRSSSPAPSGTSVRLVAADSQDTWEGEAAPQLALDGRLNLHKGVYNRIVRDFNGGRPLPTGDDDAHRRAAGLRARLVIDTGRVDDQGLRRMAEPAARRIRHRPPRVRDRAHRRRALRRPSGPVRRDLRRFQLHGVPPRENGWSSTRCASRTGSSRSWRRRCCSISAASPAIRPGSSTSNRPTWSATRPPPSTPRTRSRPRRSP